MSAMSAKRLEGGPSSRVLPLCSAEGPVDSPLLVFINAIALQLPDSPTWNLEQTAAETDALAALEARTLKPGWVPGKALEEGPPLPLCGSPQRALAGSQQQPLASQALAAADSASNRSKILR